MAAQGMVQVFGTQKSSDTRKALRFFKERRVQVQFVDLRQRAIARGELRRFVDRFGLAAIIDHQGRAYQEGGYAYRALAEEDWYELLAEDPGLLLQPLVRSGSTLSAGWDEATWRSWWSGR